MVTYIRRHPSNPEDIMHIHDRGKASYVRSSIVFFQLFAVPKVHFVHRRSTYTTAGESLKMSGRTSTMTVLTVAGLTVVGGFIAYAAYFDYKRRNDSEFRKKLRTSFISPLYDAFPRLIHARIQGRTRRRSPSRRNRLKLLQLPPL